MSSGLDLSQFYETFFDEADELLAQMEQLLLELDVGSPNIEQLNAIFRAAHSIKGGAATFGCFTQLAGTTHLLENLLDAIRRGEMALRTDMVDIFLETKDVLKSQLDAYRASEEPDEAVFERICAVLRQLALEHKDPAAAAQAPAPAPVAAPAPPPAPEPEPAPEPAAAAPAGDGAGLPLRVRITKVSDKDAEALLEEMGNLGQVRASERANGTLTVWVDSTCTPDDIEAVCCFIVDADQLNIAREAAPGAQAPAAPVEQFAQAAEQFAAQAQAQAPAPAAVAPAPAAPAVAESAAAAEAITQAARATRAAPAHADKESTSIRV
ncbi:MAG: Hpt domain-containing protein, partial [Achromobacter sp.]|nr:Hpt domain-containing protein [Achromobacter sp.]